MQFFLFLVKFLAATLLSEIFSPKIKAARNAVGGLKDLSFPTVDPTRPHQWLIGKRLIDNANIFGTFDYQGVERSRRERTGFISHTDIPLPPHYYVSAGMILCGGTGARLREVWVGDRLAWTGNAASGTSVPINISWAEDGREDYERGIRGILDFHSGSTTPNSYLVSKRGAGNVPTWRHLTYAVLRGAGESTVSIPGLGFTLYTSRNGAWIGTSKVVEHLKFVVERVPTAASTGIGAPTDGGSYWTADGEANPAYAAVEIMTSLQYGAGIDPLTLDAAAVHAAAKALTAEGHGTAQLWDNQRVSGDVVLELCRQAALILQPDPLTGLHKLRALRDTDTPVLVLDDDNIKRIDSFTRSAMDEAPNTLSLEYTSRTEKWLPRPVEVQDLAAIEVAGQVITGTASYAGITNAALAGVLAMRDLRAISAPLAIARLTAIVPKRQKFLPGDAVVLSSSKHGVTSLQMRITSARYSRPGEALCELEMIEDVFRSGEAVYSVPAPVLPSTSTNAPAVVGSGAGGAGSMAIICAPFALTQDEADHGLFFAFAPDAATTGYDLAWYAGDAAQAGYDPRRNIGFAAKGTLVGTVPDIAAVGSITVAVTAANAATLARYGSQSLYFYIDYEMMQANSVSLNAAGTQATLSGITRGIWDTVPYAHAMNPTFPTQAADVVMLCDYVIDQARLQTIAYAEAGKVVFSVDGQVELNAVSFGRNYRGTAGPSSAASFGQDWGASSSPPGYVRAPLPYSPGAVMLAGVYGSSTQAGAPGVAATSGTLKATWNPRSKAGGGLSPWDTATAPAVDPALSTSVMLQTFNGSYWTTVASYGLAAGTNQVQLPAPAGTKPLAIRCTVYAYKPVSGSVNGLMGKPQTWYWTLTA
jgi:hypothetical protein